MKEPKQLDFFDRPEEVQLPLIPYQNPLSGRLGKKFFSQVPPKPGVYQFFDERSRLLYVGKAKNLRQRLGSYRHVSPPASSRKVLRLVASIAEIRFELAADEESALLRENFLLRTHRPPFNVLNTAAHTYLFQHVSLSGAALQFHLGMNEEPGYALIFGAYKNRALLYRTQAALLRLLTAVDPHTDEGRRIPALYFTRLRLNHQEVMMRDEAVAKEAYRWVRRYFAGISPELIDQLRVKVDASVKSTFLLQLLQGDLETLEAFYVRGARSMRRLRQRLAISNPKVAQADLDDLLVRARFIKKAPPAGLEIAKSECD